MAVAHQNQEALGRCGHLLRAHISTNKGPQTIQKGELNMPRKQIDFAVGYSLNCSQLQNRLPGGMSTTPHSKAGVPTHSSPVSFLRLMINLCGGLNNDP